MPRVVVFTITRDRFLYTQKAIMSLRENAGIKYTHYVWDNNSQDGTITLLKNFQRNGIIKTFITNSENVGIHKPINQMVDQIIKDEKPDFLVKFDNDCLVCSPLILSRMIEVFEAWNHLFPKVKDKLILSPHISGLVNTIRRIGYFQVSDYTLGLVAIIGGIFRMTPIQFWKDGFRYDETAPLGHGADIRICEESKKNGYTIANVENLLALHIDGTPGQMKKYPDYFERKEAEGSL